MASPITSTHPSPINTTVDNPSRVVTKSCRQNLSLLTTNTSIPSLSLDIHPSFSKNYDDDSHGSRTSIHRYIGCYDDNYHTLARFEYKFLGNMTSLPGSFLGGSPVALWLTLERKYILQTPIPIERVEQKIDLRAVSIDSKRFRDHLFKYGFVRRAGKYKRPSMKEALGNPLKRFEDNPFIRSKPAWNNPTGPTPKQLLYNDCHDNWRWFGYHCPCCWGSWDRNQIAKMETTQNIRSTMKNLRQSRPKMNMAKDPNTKGICWDDFGYHTFDDYDLGYSYDREFELGFSYNEFDPWEYGEEGEERNVEVERNKSENIWESRENAWGSLVDKAVEKWEVKRKKEVEKLGWEVCTQETGYSTEEEEEGDTEWVDWEVVISQSRPGDSQASQGNTESVADTDTDQWTECGSSVWDMGR